MSENEGHSLVTKHMSYSKYIQNVKEGNAYVHIYVVISRNHWTWMHEYQGTKLGLHKYVGTP